MVDPKAVRVRNGSRDCPDNEITFDRERNCFGDMSRNMVVNAVGGRPRVAP